MHFDLRLELDGTLKSWAVPKGPSIELEEKRLAVMVEDHPLDYLHFEGNIPKGNYGAGTVMVWDAGTYHVFGVTQPAKVGAGRSGRDCDQGRLHLVLHGQKLKGEYGLIRMKKDDEKSWLFFKKGSAGSRRSSGEDRSVLSGRTMDEITQGAKPGKPSSEFDLSDAPKASMPHKVKPMLATPVATAFDHAGWLFELKWDGYRAIAEIDKGRVRLYSRNQRSFEKRFAPIVESLEHLGHEAVLDGEVVALDATASRVSICCRNIQVPARNPGLRSLRPASPRRSRSAKPPLDSASGTSCPARCRSAQHSVQQADPGTWAGVFRCGLGKPAGRDRCQGGRAANTAKASAANPG